MSENRFAKCETVEAVLDEYAFYAAGHTLVKSMLPPATDSFKQLRSEQSEALARIRELTPPPTVTPEQRERLDWTLTGNYPGFSDRHHAIVADLVIDALDLKAAGPQPNPAGWLAAPIDRARGAAATWRHENGFDEILDDDLDELTDRIIDALGYTVAPQPKPVVDEEARERAREVLALWAKSAIGLDLIPDFEGDPPVIDRIIQALNYVPALASLNRCSCGFTPPTHTHAEDCPVFGAAARGYTPPRGISVESSDVEHGIRLVAEAEPATLTDAPVVQVDASMALWLIQKAGELVGVDDQLTFRRGGHQLTLFRNEVGLVLRIGGDQ